MLPTSEGAVHTGFVRLVGDADAVAWVARVLSTDPARAAREVSGPGGAAIEPVVWVTRHLSSADPDAAAWSFPCLVVVPPGGEIPDLLSGHSSIESVDVVREPEDAPLVPTRIERLLLLHRRRTQTDVVLHNLPDIVLTRRLDGVLTSINAAGERFFGRPSHEMLGRPVSELISSGAPAFSDDGGHPEGRSHARVPLTDAAGRDRLFEQEALPLLDGHGQPCGIQTILSDITEEHESRERLKLEADRHEMLAAIASSARDSLDLDTILPAATALLGLRLGAHTVEIWFLNEERTACRVVHQWRASGESESLVGLERTLAESEVFRNLIASRKPYVVEDRRVLVETDFKARLLSRMGAWSFAAVPIQREGDVIGAVGITWRAPRLIPADELVFFERVADQLALAIRGARLFGNLRRQLAALALEQRGRDEAEEARRRLSAMLVHDLKNPLSAVTAALELTRDKAKDFGDARLERMLTGSLASARSLQGLIEDTLLVYRSEDAPDPEKTLALPAEVLAQPLAEARWLAEQRRITLAANVPADLPRVPLDVPRFQRAAANLLANAIKFSRPGGSVSIRAEVTTGDGPRCLRLSVADSGPGIPAEKRGLLATPYTRLPGSEEVPGTGLGLAVVRKVVDAHGGRLEVEDGPNGGAVFTVVVSG